MTATRPQRYDQCDDTSTVDCGHCKGKGRPAAPPEPEWLRNLRRDMRLEVRDTVGAGYIREYYEQLAEPFVTMAAEYIKDAARHPDVYLAPAQPTQEAAR